MLIFQSGVEWGRGRTRECGCVGVLGNVDEIRGVVVQSKCGFIELHMHIDKLQNTGQSYRMLLNTGRMNEEYVGALNHTRVDRPASAVSRDHR